MITKNDTINGIVKVDFHQNLIIIRKGNSYMTMYARSVKEVIAVGEQTEVKYFSIQYGPAKKYYLFEVISEGGLTLVYRPGIPLSTVDNSFYPAYHAIRNREIIQSLDTEKEVIKIMKDKKNEIRNYLSTKLFYVDDKVMLKEIFDFYNAL